MQSKEVVDIRPEPVNKKKKKVKQKAKAGERKQMVTTKIKK